MINDIKLNKDIIMQMNFTKINLKFMITIINLLILEEPQNKNYFLDQDLLRLINNFMIN